MDAAKLFSSLKTIAQSVQVLDGAQLALVPGLAGAALTIAREVQHAVAEHDILMSTNDQAELTQMVDSLMQKAENLGAAVDKT